jgi:hypothetical protein
MSLPVQLLLLAAGVLALWAVIRYGAPLLAAQAEKASEETAKRIGLLIIIVAAFGIGVEWGERLAVREQQPQACLEIAPYPQ